jgi:LysR family hydrogen peroxide-inducible transcriptional activator
VHLLPFRGNQTPSRRIAMVWRKSSAMAGFLKKLSEIFRDLPKGLLDARGAVVESPASSPRRHDRR